MKSRLSTIFSGILCTNGKASRLRLALGATIAAFFFALCPLSEAETFTAVFCTDANAAFSDNIAAAKSAGWSYNAGNGTKQEQKPYSYPAKFISGSLITSPQYSSPVTNIAFKAFVSNTARTIVITPYDRNGEKMEDVVKTIDSAGELVDDDVEFSLEDDIVKFDITFTVSKSATAYLYTLTITTAAAVPKTPPSIEDIADRTAFVGRAVEIPFTITENDGDSVATNVTSTADGPFSFADGIITYTPSDVDLAESTVSFTVTAEDDDCGGTPISKSFLVSVTEGTPPGIADVTAMTVFAGDTLSFTPAFIPTEGDVVTSSNVNAKAGTELVGDAKFEKGVFFFTPTAEDVGEKTFVITAADFDGEATPVEFIITVIARPAFLETFNNATKQTYASLAINDADDGHEWEGTNVNVRFEDKVLQTKHIRGRSGLAYLQLNSDKPYGLNSVSFILGREPEAKNVQNSSYSLKYSTDSGATWSELLSGEIPAEIQTITTDGNLHIAGNVRIRFDFDFAGAGTSHYFVLDTIVIEDYVSDNKTPELSLSQLSAKVEVNEPVHIELTGTDADDDELTYSIISPDLLEGCLTGNVFDWTPTVAGDYTISFCADDGKEGGKAYASLSVTVIRERVLPITFNSPLSEDFNSMGEDGKAELPFAWCAFTTNALVSSGAAPFYPARVFNTERAPGTNGFTNAAIFNFGTNNQDRAVGFLGSSEKYRTCALMVKVRNMGQTAIHDFDVVFTVEKWKYNTNTPNVKLRYSFDGVEWAPATESATELDADFIAGSNVPAVSQIAINLKTPVKPGQDIFLAWCYEGDSQGNNASFGFDDIEISANPSKATVLLLK